MFTVFSLKYCTLQVKLYRALVARGREEPGARQLLALSAHLVAHKDSLVRQQNCTTELLHDLSLTTKLLNKRND